MPVTLLTDFGTADYFVAAMKGVLLERSPRTPIVDLTHEIPAHDVAAGAFTLLAAYPAFPAGTIHVGVVDPGVGSERRAILVLAAGQRFVGPDNGLFSYLLDREPEARVVHLTEERFFRAPVSPTFHGRDVFAPVAGALAAGVTAEEVGVEVDDPVRLDPVVPRRTAGGEVVGSILHVDRFGNCVTSVSPADLTPAMRERGLRVSAGGREIRSVRRYFAQPGASAGEPFAIWGSAGFLEIAVDRDSASRRLGLRRGDPVSLAAAAPGQRG